MDREVLIDNEYGKLSMELFQGIPLLHLKIHKWSHNIFKKIILPLWIDVLNELKARGHTVVLAVIPEEDVFIAKFHSLMGMHEANRGEGYIISRRWL